MCAAEGINADYGRGSSDAIRQPAASAAHGHVYRRNYATVFSPTGLLRGLNFIRPIHKTHTQLTTIKGNNRERSVERTRLLLQTAIL